MNLGRRRIKTRFAGLAALAVLGLPAGIAALEAPAAQAAPARTTTAGELTRVVSSQGTTITVRLQPIAVRSAGFEVLVQQDDGSYARPQVTPERTYLGTADEDPSAVVTGVIGTNGLFRGKVTFDRGLDWDFQDTGNGEETWVTSGATNPTETYRWPTSDEPGRDVSTAPGQVGSTTHGWTIGIDVAHDYYADAGSVARVLEEIDYDTVTMLGVYQTDALLRPSIDRVVIRGSATADPYGPTAPSDGRGALSLFSSVWNQHHARADVDARALFWSAYTSGGAAASMSIATPTALAVIGGGLVENYPLVAHELGHEWGARDWHTNSPEGPTIDSGNYLNRFDGTEVSAIMRVRDDRLARPTSPFENLGRFGPSLPPYAALDLVDDLRSGVPVILDPVANDHDANGDQLKLESVEPTSHLGGVVTRCGGSVRYTPPKVASTTVDWVEYVVRDSSGRTATGVALLRVGPP